MRRLPLVAPLALVVAACTPEIGSGTYFCGPERFCPPELVCDDNLYTCVRPSTAEPFVCPEGAEQAEPDGTVEQGNDVGELVCGGDLGIGAGCMAAGDDSDVFSFTIPTACIGADPHLSVLLRFPVALVPLRVELVDGAGTPMAAGEDCTPAEDFTGMRQLCIETGLDPGDYHLRVTIDPEGADCGGACRYNSYRLDVLFPLS